MLSGAYVLLLSPRIICQLAFISFFSTSLTFPFHFSTFLNPAQSDQLLCDVIFLDSIQLMIASLPIHYVFQSISFAFFQARQLVFGIIHSAALTVHIDLKAVRSVIIYGFLFLGFEFHEIFQ